MGSFIAAGTSYATHGEPMIPIYIFYSMFGFQRTGDLMWAAGDQMARGFLLGATAGRTTLNGEGLQHQDGHSLLLASTNPACVAYDPAFAFEIAYIVEDALRRMYGSTEEHPDGENIFYYLTVYNEPYPAAGRARGPRRRGPAQGPLPLRAGAELRRRPAAGADPRLGCRDAVGAGGAGAAGRGVGRRGRRLVGDLVERAAPRRGGVRGVEPAAPRRGAAHAVRHPGAGRAHPARSSRSATGCGRCRTRSRAGCPATTPRSARTASAAPTPAARPGATSTSTPQSIVVAVLTELARRGEVKHEVLRQAIERYQLLDVQAAGAGPTGGEN